MSARKASCLAGPELELGGLGTEGGGEEEKEESASEHDGYYCTIAMRTIFDGALVDRGGRISRGCEVGVRW